MTDQGPKPTESTPSPELPQSEPPAEANGATDPPIESSVADLLAGQSGETADLATTDATLNPAEPAVRQIQEQYRYSDEAREALLGSILRMVDEHRFGHRDLSTEEVRDLAEAWSALNDGLTGTEVGYNWTIRRLHARRSESRRHD